MDYPTEMQVKMDILAEERRKEIWRDFHARNPNAKKYDSPLGEMIQKAIYSMASEGIGGA